MKTVMEMANEVKKEAESKKYIITDVKTGQSFKYGDDPYMDQQLENCLFVDLFQDIVPDKADYYGFNRNQYLIKKANSGRRHNISSINLQIVSVSPYRGDKYEGIEIAWESDIGFGQYNIARDLTDDNNDWFADSETMDSNDDKTFLEELMKQFIKSIDII